jgi:hypothetical protein
MVWIARQAIFIDSEQIAVAFDLLGFNVVAVLA